MTYIAKPKLHHPSLHVNKVGYTRRDYEGRVSTLCAGTGTQLTSLVGSYIKHSVTLRKGRILPSLGNETNQNE